MFKSKMKKIVGTALFTGALMFSAIPADAAPNLIPIRDKYDGYQYQWNGYNSSGVATVTVFFRDSNGKSYSNTYECVTVISGTCYVYE